MTRVIIIRHCKTIDNEAGKLQGYNNDSGFTEEGLTQLKKIVERLKNEDIKAVFSSDLGRALKTAKAIADEHNLEVIPLKDLREADIGEWGDLPVKEAIGKWIKYYDEEKSKGIPRETIRPPSGENSWDHQRRLKKAVKEIIDNYPKDTIVIVGHSGTNRVIIGTFEEKDPDDFYSISQDNACINIIETDGEKSKVVLLNDTQHL